MGKAISSFALGSKDGLDEMTKGDFDFSKLGELIPVVMDRIDEAETIEKINLILESVTHEGNVLNIDYLIFDGRLDLLFKVLKKALIHNYKFFFTEEILEKLALSKKIIQESQKS